MLCVVLLDGDQYVSPRERRLLGNRCADERHSETRGLITFEIAVEYLYRINELKSGKRKLLKNPTEEHVLRNDGHRPIALLSARDRSACRGPAELIQRVTLWSRIATSNR